MFDAGKRGMNEMILLLFSTIGRFIKN